MGSAAAFRTGAVIIFASLFVDINKNIKEVRFVLRIESMYSCVYSRYLTAHTDPITRHMDNGCMVKW